MFELGQELSLAVKAAARVRERRRQQLDGDIFHEGAVVPFREVDRAHAAAAEQALKPVGAEGVARQVAGRRRSRQRRDTGQKRPRTLVRVEERLDLDGRGRVGETEVGQESGAHVRLQVKRVAEQLRDPCPLFACHTCPASSCRGAARTGRAARPAHSAVG
jgi:hypothetical protein